MFYIFLSSVGSIKKTHKNPSDIINESTSFVFRTGVNKNQRLMVKNFPLRPFPISLVYTKPTAFVSELSN